MICHSSEDKLLLFSQGSLASENQRRLILKTLAITIEHILVEVLYEYLLTVLNICLLGKSAHVFHLCLHAWGPCVNPTK